MRIMFVLEATLGGTRRYLEDCFHALRGTSMDGAIVYATRRADSAFHHLLADMRGAGWSSFELDMVREIQPMHDFRAVMALRKIYRSWKPDIVHLVSSKAGGVGRLAAIGLPNVSLCYSPAAIAHTLGHKYVVAERLLSGRTKAFITASDSEKRELVEFRIAEASRIHTVSPTVSSEYFTPISRSEARRQLLIPDNVPVIVGIGRLAPQKDPETFVRALDFVRREMPDVLGIWTGDGEMRPVVEKLIAELGLVDAMKITGWQDDVRSYIAASDVFLSTARYESFGYVTAEALAMGRPVVASHIGGTRDIITEDQEVIMYPVGDAQKAAQNLLSFLRDRKLSQAVAERGRKRVAETFSRSVTNSGLTQAYTAALAR